jgi:multicomponent Na+:H+ antiporter subunit D
MNLSFLQHTPALVVGIPLLSAFAMPLLGKIHEKVRNGLAIIGMLLTSAVGLYLAYQVLTTGSMVYVFGAASPDLTIPQDSGGIPIRIIFTIDAFSAFMIVIVSIVGLMSTLYSLATEKLRSGQADFFALLLLLVAGVIGMVSTGDLFNLFVFLEISSLAGAALVAYRINKGLAVEAGLKYALMSTVAGLFFLLGVAIFYGQYGTLNIAQIAQSIRMTRLDIIALVLIIVPMAMKCGAVPLHMWTPDAYSRAPAAVTAFLVVSSQASMYVLFRIFFTLFNLNLNTATFGWVLVILGVLSMVVGVTMAIPQKDVKRLMAYHAVSQSGYMLLGVGVGLATLGNKELLDAYGKTAMVGGIFHIMNHALYKGLLFLTAGAVIYTTGKRDLNDLGGLGHTMKYTMIFFIIGALAIAGIPPLNGFASKFMIYESVFLFNPFIAIIAIVVSILTLASFMKVFHSMFMGPKLPQFKEAKEVPASMLIAMGVMAVLVVLGGLFPDLIVKNIVEPAVQALLEQSQYIGIVMGGK